MAYVSSQTSTQSRFPSVVADLFASVKATMLRRAVYVRTLRELHALTPRELMDLGIDAGNVHAVAREAAYGN